MSNGHEGQLQHIIVCKRSHLDTHSSPTSELASVCSANSNTFCRIYMSEAPEDALEMVFEATNVLLGKDPLTLPKTSQAEDGGAN